MLSRLGGRAIEDKLEQKAKAILPILLILLGRVIDAKLLHK